MEGSAGYCIVGIAIWETNLQETRFYGTNFLFCMQAIGVKVDLKSKLHL